MFGSKKEVRKPRPGVAIGPDDMDCPFHQRPMSEVCHSCPLWQMLRGVHPQTGEPIPDEWNCSFAHMTKLSLEFSQQARQAGASSDKVATEVAKFHKSMVAMNHIAINQEQLKRLE
jgi:hypothetical protein